MAGDGEGLNDGELEQQQLDTNDGGDGAGAEGQDTERRDDDAPIPTEQPDSGADDGEPQSSAAGERTGQSRTSARFQQLNNDNKELRAKLESIERERRQEQQRQWTAQQNLTEQQERERFALMTDAEKNEYRIAKMEQSFRQQTTQASVQMQVMADKIAYDAKAAVHPVYSKYQDQVEREFQSLLQQGKPVEREIILKNILGTRALEMANNGKQRRQAERRVANQTVGASSGKGDAASARGKAGDSPEKRLQGVFI